MAKLQFELVAPSRLLLSVEADQVALPGSEGDMGILPGHAPLISSLRPGVIEVEGLAEAEDTRFYVPGGFMEIANDRLTVLAEEVTPMSKLDRAQLEQQIQNLKEDVADAKDDAVRQRAEEKLAGVEQMLAAL